MLHAVFTSPKARETFTSCVITGVTSWFALGLMKQEYLEAEYRKRDRELREMPAAQHNISAKYGKMASSAK
ncbi:hypothetical protein HOY82DRAFT_600187 [Tuber indicum]|nr:hypothetical protein HOY82DRAFT_600187 [Tuber indicum]